MEAVKKIKLQESLKYIEKIPEGKVTTFFNSSGQLETFFTYKANVIDIHKEKMKIDLGKSSAEEVGESLRSQICAFLQKGYIIVLNLGGNENFDIIKFFSQFPWFSKDLFKDRNYYDRNFLLKSKILTQNEDWDLTNSFKGGYQVMETSRLYFLSGAEEKDVENFMKNNSEIPLEALIVD